jgi:hypothetical protein
MRPSLPVQQRWGGRRLRRERLGTGPIWKPPRQSHRHRRTRSRRRRCPISRARHRANRANRRSRADRRSRASRSGGSRPLGRLSLFTSAYRFPCPKEPGTRRFMASVRLGSTGYIRSKSFQAFHPYSGGGDSGVRISAMMAVTRGRSRGRRRRELRPSALGRRRKRQQRHPERNLGELLGEDPVELAVRVPRRGLHGAILAVYLRQCGSPESKPSALRMTPRGIDG